MSDGLEYAFLSPDNFNFYSWSGSGQRSGRSVRCVADDYSVGCSCQEIPEGHCDCDGNELDALGICGGDCAADVDADGICDDVDDCVVDACGICNGPGAIYECGCADIPEGDCDCDGNALDALGVCGGGAPWMLTMTVYATATLRGHVDIPMNTKVILTLQ